MDNWYIGTDLKFLIEMNSSGFSMDDDDWSILVRSSSKIVQEIPKGECLRDSDGKWYVHINAGYLKNGELALVAHIKVPDPNFDDGFRDEYEVLVVGKINKI